MPKKTDAECRALATAFFRDDLHEGQPCRTPVVPYRAFANPNGHLAEAEARTMQRLVLGLPPFVACHDLASLLSAQNWRFHAIASGGIGLSSAWCVKVQMLLWMRIRLGCATVPQLVAAASVADEEFMARSQRLLTLRSTTEDSAAAVSAVLTWLKLRDEVAQDPRGLAAKLSEWGPVGSRAVAWHHVFSRLRIAA